MEFSKLYGPSASLNESGACTLTHKLSCKSDYLYLLYGANKARCKHYLKDLLVDMRLAKPCKDLK